MDSSWPPRLEVGDRVRFDSRAWVVSGFMPAGVRLTDPLGDVVVLPVSRLVTAADFGVLEPGLSYGPRPRLGPRIPDQALERAQWWADHLEEVITGLRPGVPETTKPRPGYDPSTCSLVAREAAKATELTALGVPGASARSVRRRRQRYQAAGVDGLVDRRTVRTWAPGARQDLRVLEVLLTLANDDLAQTGRLVAAEQYRRTTRRLLDTMYGPGTVTLPSRSTFQRLLKKITMEQLLETGTPVATTDGIQMSRPGERVHVDTICLDLPPHMVGHFPQRLLLTVAVDELTWTVCTVMVRAPQDPLDGLLLLARLCAPAALRDAARDDSAQERGGTEMPLILPECLVLDRGKLARPRRFAAACGTLGMGLVPARPGTRAKREHILRHFADGFREHLARHVAGQFADETALIAWLQRCAERWVESVWQHHPRPALLSVTGAGAEPTPSAAYAACIARTGWVLLPPGPDRFIEFLPSAQRRVGERGVSVHGYRYDCPGLDPLRLPRQRAASSPISHHEVRFDPHDVRQVWVRLANETWVTVPLLPADAAPFARPRPRSAPAGSSPAFPHLPPDIERSHSSLPGRRRPATVVDWLPEEGFTPFPRQATDDADRLAYHTHLPLLETPLIQEVRSAGRRLAVLCQYAPGARQGLLVSGPPDSGKTTALRELARDFEHFERARHPDERHRVPVIYLHLRPEATGRSVLTDLGQFVPTPPPGRRQSAGELLDAVAEALIAAGTGMVVVDDADHLLSSSPVSCREVEYLRFLVDRTSAAFVYVVREGQAVTFSESTQGHLPRLTHLRASPVPRGSEWRRLVEVLDESLRLRRHQPQSLTARAEVLYRMAEGWPGALTQIIQAAAVEAILSGSEEITEQELGTVAP